MAFDAFDIWAKSSGKEHPDYAPCLDDLAIFYHNNVRKIRKSREPFDFWKPSPFSEKRLAKNTLIMGKDHNESLAKYHSDLENNEKANHLS
ncbi:MAG: hypothetical protein IPH31_18245 [Lewinellaceae bacterium]|nr:hypothetical protein [Lewinellaceae bacterium]